MEKVTVFIYSLLVALQVFLIWLFLHDVVEDVQKLQLMSSLIQMCCSVGLTGFALITIFFRKNSFAANAFKVALALFTIGSTFAMMYIGVQLFLVALE